MPIASWTWIQDRNVIPKPNFLNWTGLGWMSGATNCHLSGCLQLLVFEDEDVCKVLINIFHTSLCCVAVNRNVSFSFLVALWPCGLVTSRYSCFDSLIGLLVFMFDCVWSSYRDSSALKGSIHALTAWSDYWFICLIVFDPHAELLEESICWVPNPTDLDQRQHGLSDQQVLFFLLLFAFWLFIITLLVNETLNYSQISHV